MHMARLSTNCLILKFIKSNYKDLKLIPPSHPRTPCLSLWIYISAVFIIRLYVNVPSFPKIPTILRDILLYFLEAKR